MTPPELTALFTAAGWFAAAIFVAVLAGAPGALPGRTAGWLLAGALLRAVATAVPGSDGNIRHVLALLAAVAWWESTRQMQPVAGRASARWLLAPLEIIALLVAVELGLAGEERPDWFWTIDALVRTAPAVLAVCGLRWWWRALPAAGYWRAAGTGFALACALPAAVDWLRWFELSFAWLAAAGFGAWALSLPTARTRAALCFLGGAAAVLAATPFAATVAADRAAAAIQAELVDDTRRAAATFRLSLLPQLGHASPASTEAGRMFVRAAADLRATDSAVRSAVLWRPAGKALERLDESGGFQPWRAGTADELRAAAAGQTFVIAADGTTKAAAMVAHAPLRATRFESPAAWLALEFPALLRTSRIEAARRTATTGFALLAAIAAGVFVLVVRQAREAAQHGALARAHAADRAKTEFLAFLGHELRTPLQVILGRAEQLARDGSDEVRVQAADAIRTQSRLMLRQVNDLLDLGTLEAGRLELRPEPVALRRLVAAAAEAVAPAAAQRGLTCTVQVGNDLPDTVWADEPRVLQILGNLLGNAVKYTATGGVELHVDAVAATPAAPARIRFRVRDTGIGLPADKIERLFILFERLDTGSTFTRDGTGVGLALVRRLAEAMGGTVAAANRSDGPGAEFTVELPLPPAPARSDLKLPAPALPPAIRGRVLVAEDHPAVAAVLSAHLEALGCEPVLAADGLSARQVAAAGPLAAALLDINLPGLDGVSLARELARLVPRPRLIGCSAEVLPATRAAALAAGMDEFLAKPVSFDDLRRALASVASGPDFFAALRHPADAPARDLARRGLPAAQAAVVAALAGGNPADIAQRAHYLRNSALVLGETDLALTAAAIETAAQAGDIAGARSAAARSRVDA